VIFHAGRGCQYISAGFAGLATGCAVTLSDGRTGQCWDNALAGSFFASVKRRAARLPGLASPGPGPAGDRGMHRLVQRCRLHSTLGYRSPAGFEKARKIKKVAWPGCQPCPSKRGSPITAIFR
jgi:transposase InsO family protein